MKSKRNASHMIDMLFTLGLLLVFAASALAVVLIGAHVYKTTAANMDTNYTSRTSLSYAAEKIRQHDESGSIFTGKVEDEDALILLETIDGKEYATYIYEDDGMLKELFTDKNTSVQKKLGDAILEVQNFTIEALEGGFIRFTATDKENHTLSLLIHPQSKQKGDSCER